MGGMRAALIGALAIGGTAATARAQDDGGGAAFHATTLNVAGEGEVRVRPDLAVVSVGVRSDGPTAAAVLAQNRQQMSAVIAALKRQGVAEADIQTSNLDLQPQYADDNGKAPRRLSGYETDNTVSVRLHDLQRVGAVVDALVAAGANQVQGVAFGLDDPTAAEDAARRAAVKALQTRAELYASAAGYRLQRLVRLTDQSVSRPQPMPMARMMMAEKISSPVEPGELTVRAEVQGEYELTR